MLVILQCVSHLLCVYITGNQVHLGIDSNLADCKTITVGSGDGCASLATRCGLSGNTFMSYNPGLSCSKLTVGQVSDDRPV
jgi:LysM domain